MNKTILAIAVAGSLAVSLSAFANKGAEYKGEHRHHSDWSKNWYIGGGINGNAANTQSDTFNDGDAFDVSELEEAKVGFDIYAGRNINKRWAAEIGFTQVGDVTFSFEDGDHDDDSEEVEISQWNIHLVGIYKLRVADSFHLFGKFGAAYLNSTETDEFINVETGDTFENDEDELGTFALTYGFGAEFGWDRWGIRGEYNVLKPSADVTSGDFWTDSFYVADIVSLNAFYRFSY